MAIRSGAGTGVIVSLVVFVLSSVFLLVLSIVFYLEKQGLNELVNKAKPTLKACEDETDKVNKQLEELNKLLTGNPNESIDKIKSQFSADISLGSPLVMIFSKMQSQIQSGQQELNGRVEALASAHDTIDSLDTQLKEQADSKAYEVQLVKTEWQDVQDDAVALNTKADEYFDTRKEKLKSIRADTIARIDFLEQDIKEMIQEKAHLMTKIYNLREKINSSSIDSVDPSLLVDGKVIDVGSGSEVFIDRGKNDHVVLGMSFDIYESPSQLRVDKDGNFSRGKATVEVVKVGPTTSTAKITRSTPGQPVVRDNIIVNPVYDPNYRFSFIVHGNFDADGDGVAESNNNFIKDQIARWGGVVYEDNGVIPGDLDFLVLGISPRAPVGKLKRGATIAAENAYNAQQSEYLDYESLREQAKTAGVPVLTANRLYILTGYQGR